MFSSALTEEQTVLPLHLMVPTQGPSITRFAEDKK